jgi:hypothetical protein
LEKDVNAAVAVTFPKSALESKVSAINVYNCMQKIQTLSQQFDCNFATPACHKASQNLDWRKSAHLM